MDSLRDSAAALNVAMETIEIDGGQRASLPVGMCESWDIFKYVVSMHTWNSLSEENKAHLMTFLPGVEGSRDVDKHAVVSQLLQLQCCTLAGSVLGLIHRKIRAGHLSSPVSSLRTWTHSVRDVNARFCMHDRMTKLMEELLTRRARLMQLSWRSGNPSVSTELPNSQKRRLVSLDRRVLRRYWRELRRMRRECGAADIDSSDDETVSSLVPSTMSGVSYDEACWRCSSVVLSAPSGVSNGHDSVLSRRPVLPGLPAHQASDTQREQTTDTVLCCSSDHDCISTSNSEESDSNCHNDNDNLCL